MPRTPDRTVSRTELQRLVAVGAVQLVGALGPDFSVDARLPGALNIPPGRVDELAASLLDRSRPVVVYCSRTCYNAEATARRLVELGQPDVWVYAGGKEDWVEAGVPVERGDGR
jgi:rhodanese-related sulfurtransferase